MDFCQGGIGVAGEVHTGVSLTLRRIIHDVMSTPKPGPIHMWRRYWLERVLSRREILRA